MKLFINAYRLLLTLFILFGPCGASGTLSDAELRLVKVMGFAANPVEALPDLRGFTGVDVSAARSEYGVSVAGLISKLEALETSSELREEDNPVVVAAPGSPLTFGGDTEYLDDYAKNEIQPVVNAEYRKIAKYLPWLELPETEFHLLYRWVSSFNSEDQTISLEGELVVNGVLPAIAMHEYIHAILYVEWGDIKYDFWRDSAEEVLADLYTEMFMSSRYDLSFALIGQRQFKPLPGVEPQDIQERHLSTFRSRQFLYTVFSSLKTKEEKYTFFDEVMQTLGKALRERSGSVDATTVDLYLIEALKSQFHGCSKTLVPASR